MIVRPVRDCARDAEAVRTVAAAAFAPWDGRGWTRPRVERHHRRTLHLARVDPGGCWLAEDAQGAAVGAALSARREGTWGLSLWAVTPRAQGRGVGQALLARTLEYGSGCLRGLIRDSAPVAAGAYRRAGFSPHPTMCLSGQLTHERLERPDGPVVPGSASHVDLLDSVDRRLRGGARGADHVELLRDFPLLVCDDLAGSGYCYFDQEGRVELLAATSRRLAARLLVTALWRMSEGTQVRVEGLTAEQQWAVDVGLAAGLRVRNEGFLCLRGLRPPEPYIPSGAYL